MAAGGGSNRLGGDGRPALPLPGGAAGGLRRFGSFQNVLLGVALLIGGLGGYYGFTHFYQSSHQPPATGQPVRVARTTIRSTVSATGTVTATEQSNLTFQASGQITNILVKAGDVLQQGQALAVLDTRTAMISRDQARSALSTAHAKLDALLAGATPDVVAAARQAVVQATSGITSSSTNITTSQATLTNSQNQLANLLNGPTPTQIEQVQAGVDSAQASLNIAQSNFDKLVSHSDLATRTETTTLAVAKQNYETAVANYLNKLTPPLSGNVAQAQTNVKLARDAYQTAQLKNLQVQADPTAGIADKLASQNQVTSASAAVDAAQSALQLLQQGTDQTDIAAAQAQVDNSRVALQSAQANYNNLVALSDLVSRPEYSSLTQAKSQYETAKAAYDAQLAPPQPTDVSSAQAGVSAGQAAVQSAQAGIPSAQAALQAAQAKLTQTVGPPLPTDITQATEAINTAQLALQNAQLTLDNQTLVAPFAGTIISVPANIGNQVTSATVIATLVNPQALEVDANVDETAVTQLQAGQQAMVTLDAIPGRTFPATVAAVTPSGTTQQGVVVFPIVFTLDTQGQKIPAGASANITVVTKTTPNVLAVPSRYVHKVGANNVVDVLENNKRISKPVTIGTTNGQLTEISSGLNAGDVAIPPEQTRGGSTFGAAGPGGGPPAP